MYNIYQKPGDEGDLLLLSSGGIQDILHHTDSKCNLDFEENTYIGDWCFCFISA